MAESTSAVPDSPRTRARRRELRDAISAAALDLACERGLDSVTVDEIARAANVSRRTFFNYFSSKAAACVIGYFRADDHAVRQFLTDRSVSTMTAIGRLLWRHVELARRENPYFDRFHDLWRQEPAIRPEVHAMLARTEGVLTTLILRREGHPADTAPTDTAPTDTDPTDADPGDAPAGDAGTAAVAAAAIATLRVAIEQWRTDEAPELLESRIRESFAAVASASGPPAADDA